MCLSRGLTNVTEPPPSLGRRQQLSLRCDRCPGPFLHFCWWPCSPGARLPPRPPASRTRSAPRAAAASEGVGRCVWMTPIAPLDRRARMGPAGLAPSAPPPRTVRRASTARRAGACAARMRRVPPTRCAGRAGVRTAAGARGTRTACPASTAR
ncbi:hypothetical protein DB31_5696 [Hyalangium minutum]|uniref:Uncharacterized protein n=1 Tax=Hyalangium minutum TaxID=394096 RepID=A0A085WSJ1_9BACT|nr:hypothetical protein DB31_5696 [Hyalangium minutum]